VIPVTDESGERAALIAEGRGRPLTADEAAEVGLLTELLADPSTWVEPRAELEDAVVRAVCDPEDEVSRPHRRRLAVVGVAAAALIALLVAVGVVLLGGGAAPDYGGELAATELAPGARGTVEVTRTDAGFRIVLDARELPPLAPGEFYEGWLKDAAGTLVPIGSFSSGDDTVTLWSGVSPDDFPELTVTIETADGDQASSGRRVLAGVLRPS
jgi:hypothetical protein